MAEQYNLQHTKDVFRVDSLKKLKGIARSSYGYKKDKEITNRLLRFIKQNRPNVVMAYMPLELECDISEVIHYLRRHKKRVFVPFMEGKSFRLVQYRLPLQKNKYGIREPRISKNNTKKPIDLAIVPIVGTDFTFRRVGFGKGMYDRFFSKHDKYIRTTVFVTRQLCYNQILTTNNHDISADGICVSRASLPKALRYNKHFL